MKEVDWAYFDKYEDIDAKYLPARGEGDNMATQIVTAVAKLVYKYYNDGDVYDNTYFLQGWANDLSSYANWLDQYTGASYILGRIKECRTYAQYSWLLKDLTDLLEDEEYLAMMEKREKVGSIYDCKGRFKFEYVYEDSEDEEEDWTEEDEDC